MFQNQDKYMIVEFQEGLENEEQYMAVEFQDRLERQDIQDKYDK